MCGVIACRTKTSAAPYLLAGLRRLEYRRCHGTGVAIRTRAGDLARLRSVDGISALEQLVDDAAAEVGLGAVGIGHTRWATQGSVTGTNAYPPNDCKGQISLVHNGIVANADKLRQALSISGHRFESDVDSEVLCHLIEDQIQLCGDLFESVETALTPVDGIWAIAVLQKQTGSLVVAANGCPMLIARTELGDFATSEVAAIEPWTDECRILENGDVAELGGIRRWRNGGRKVSPRTAVMCSSRRRDMRSSFQEESTARSAGEVQSRIVNGNRLTTKEDPKLPLWISTAPRLSDAARS
jgi:glucosamine--fructose-6-phosphate aminotransferase (isomerizing)